MVALAVGAALVMPAAAGAGQRAYFAGFTPNPLLQTSPLGADGSLGPAPGPSPDAGSFQLEGVTLTPDGSQVLAGSIGNAPLPLTNSRIRNFSVAANGTLTPGPGPAFVDTGSPAADPLGLVVTPNGKFVYQSAQKDSRISGAAIAADGSLSASIPGLPKIVTAKPQGLAVSRDGKYLYAAEFGAGVGAFAIGADGSLTEVAGSPYPSPSKPVAISLTPDGRYLFAAAGDPADSSPNTLTLAVQPNGSLTYPAGGSIPLPANAQASGSTVTPNGHFYYVVNYNKNSLSGFSIGSDGLLTDLSGSPYALGVGPTAVAAEADGTHLYITHLSSPNVDVLAISPSGVPAPITGSPFPIGPTGDFQSVALSPDQPPKAKLAISGQSKTGVTLDASGSADTDGGQVAHYYWDFGDGQTTDGTDPVVTHPYPADGVFFPSVTTTDEKGCGSQYVSAGQTPYCNGSAKAVDTAEVGTIKPKLKAKAKKRQKLSKPLKVGVSVPNVPVSVTAAATAKLKGSKAKKVTYNPASVSLKPGLKILKLKLKGKSLKAAKSASSGKAAVTVTGTGNGYEVVEKLKVKLR